MGMVLDLFVLNLVEPNQLFEGTENGRFLDRSLELGIVQNSHYYPGSTWGDPDQMGIWIYWYLHQGRTFWDLRLGTMPISLRRLDQIGCT